MIEVKWQNWDGDDSQNEVEPLGNYLSNEFENTIFFRFIQNDKHHHLSLKSNLMTILLSEFQDFITRSR